MLFIAVFTCRFLGAQSTLYLDMEIIDYSTMLPKGWSAKGDKSIMRLKLDSSTKQRGKYSLLIETLRPNGDEEAAVFYSIKAAQAGQKFTFKGFLKTENNSGGFFFIRMNGNKAVNYTVVNNDGVDLKDKGYNPTGDWQAFSFTTDYDAIDADSIHFGIVPGEKGKIWLDNVSLEFDGKDITKAPLNKLQVYPARMDTVFRYSSGITSLTANNQVIENLTNLGMLWGFLKYYHPSIGMGNYNWDAELFRILPTVMAAENKLAAHKAMEEWLDKLGKPEKCKQCIAINKDSNVRMMPDYGILFKKGNFPASLTAKLQYIIQNRTSDNKYYIRLDYYGRPYFKNEDAYEQMTSPDVGYRLLALYRYWNAIQYFYPYRHLIGEGWNKVLSEFIPKFLQASDSVSYTLVCAEVATRIQDSHAGVQSRIMGDFFGRFAPPIQVKFIEDQLAVTDYYISDSVTQRQFKIGDIVTKIGDKTVTELKKYYSSIVSASNYPRLLFNMQSLMLRGNTAEADIEILREGKTFTIRMKRIARGNAANTLKDRDPSPKDSSFKFINNSIGYFFPGKYKDAQFDRIKEAFKNTKGMIIDFRTYPTACTECLFSSWINMNADDVRRSTKGNLYTPGLFTYHPKTKKAKTANEYYKGKVIVLVNERTVSAAEGQASSLRTAPNVKILGTTTAGANGDNAGIVLPGNVRTSFTGIGIYNTYGLWAQRTGLKIDVTVKPTIKGIKEGRDEVLEKAIEIIENQ